MPTIFVTANLITGVQLGAEYVSSGEIDSDSYIIVNLFIVCFVISW